MKHLFSMCVILFVATSAAHAELVGGGTPDCKVVTIERPNVTASPTTVRFKNTKDASADMLSAITKCNDGIQDSGFVKAANAPTGGVRVLFNANVGPVGSGKILLPVSFTDGSVDEVVCIRPARQGAPPTHQKYATAWSGTLLNTITLQKLDNYDKAAADVGCVAAAGK